ncbi:MAG: TlpA family protein disulfide reductase [Candidatus Hinthialibacter sp.]
MMKNRLFHLSIGAAIAGIILMNYVTAASEKPHKLELGKTAPSFEGRLLDKKLLKLEDLFEKNNKVVLLDFWASWCPPCRAEIPHLQEIYKEFHDEGLELVSINVNESSEVIEKFKVKTPMPWKHIRDIKGEISKLYGVNSIPSLFLIDHNGVLVAMGSDLRGERIKKTIAKHIKNLPEKEITQN